LRRRNLSEKAGALIIVFAHGSNVPEANQAIVRLAGEVSRMAGLPAIAAFLELAQPDLATALAGAASAGSRRVVIVPCFLAMGVHVREDLPKLVEQQRPRFPGLQLVLAQSLEGHPGVAPILAERAQQALAGNAPVSAANVKG
jgi:sirohydrochlorin cobaltochelatase